MRDSEAGAQSPAVCEQLFHARSGGPLRCGMGSRQAPAPCSLVRAALSAAGRLGATVSSDALSDI